MDKPANGIGERKGVSPGKPEPVILAGHPIANPRVTLSFE
jgi:hypothetical protein